MSATARMPSPIPPGATTLSGDGRPLRPGLVRRERLLTHLAGTREMPLITVVAPTGYGKTTALADWVEQDTRPSAWISLDERHNDPAFLVGSIASLLDEIEPLGLDVFAPLSMARSSMSGAVVPRLCEALGDRSQPFVIVLDDLHLISNRAALEPLATIAQCVPAGSQIAVAARSEPSLPLGSMRAHRLLAEVRAEELAMTRSEAARALAASGIELDRESLGRLVERTEGWPVGLYLAALSLAGKDDVEAAIDEFHGDDRVVADYLRDAFLSGLDRDDLAFLTRTSVLDTLSGDLCDAVLARQGSAQALRRLSRSNLLIVPLDTRDHTYRHHHLLREMLKSELHRMGARQESEVHARASDWYCERGDVDRAVLHAIAAGDPARAGALIWANTAEYESRGRHATVQSWLAKFSEQEVAASPGLCLAKATGDLTDGNGAGVEHWTGLALGGLTELELPETADTEVSARVIRAAGAARNGIVQMRAEVQAAYGMLAHDSPWRVICLLIEGVSLHLGGDCAAGRVPLEEGVRLGAAIAPSVQSLCRAQLVLLSLDEDDETEAERHAMLALEEADHYGLGDYPTQAMVFAVSALVRARRGRTDSAAADAKTSIRMLSGLVELSPWYEAEARITLARALLMLDDVAAARVQLADAGRYLRQTPDATVLREWLEAAWAEVEVASSVGGRWPLTPAELRLLHVLPTHHSFREIADQLYVSPNTVKTQAQSVYRKLGVSSRAEAVDCARAAGLLGAVGEARGPA